MRFLKTSCGFLKIYYFGGHFTFFQLINIFFNLCKIYLILSADRALKANVDFVHSCTLSAVNSLIALCQRHSKSFTLFISQGHFKLLLKCIHPWSNHL